jgi:hypothetical protein
VHPLRPRRLLGQPRTMGAESGHSGPQLIGDAAGRTVIPTAIRRITNTMADSSDSVTNSAPGVREAKEAIRWQLREALRASAQTHPYAVGNLPPGPLDLAIRLKSSGTE